MSRYGFPFSSIQCSWLQDLDSPWPSLDLLSEPLTQDSQVSFSIYLSTLILYFLFPSPFFSPFPLFLPLSSLFSFLFPIIPASVYIIDPDHSTSKHFPSLAFEFHVYTDLLPHVFLVSHSRVRTKCSFQTHFKMCTEPCTGRQAGDIRSRQVTDQDLEDPLLPPIQVSAKYVQFYLETFLWEASFHPR